MFADFNRFKKRFEGLEHVKCEECDRRSDCKKVERYEDGTYQPINNHYYHFGGYGCHQEIKGGEIND